MTNAEMLTQVKAALGITGDYLDNTLNVYIEEVKNFMISAGVLEEVANSASSVGCICRGVADLWNNGSGNASLSKYFIQRMLQLKAGSQEGENNG